MLSYLEDYGGLYGPAQSLAFRQKPPLNTYSDIEV